MNKEKILNSQNNIINENQKEKNIKTMEIE